MLFFIITSFILTGCGGRASQTWAQFEHNRRVNSVPYHHYHHCDWNNGLDTDLRIARSHHLNRLLAGPGIGWRCKRCVNIQSPLLYLIPSSQPSPGGEMEILRGFLNIYNAAMKTVFWFSLNEQSGCCFFVRWSDNGQISFVLCYQSPFITDSPWFRSDRAPQPESGCSRVGWKCLEST